MAKDIRHLKGWAMADKMASHKCIQNVFAWVQIYERLAIIRFFGGDALIEESKALITPLFQEYYDKKWELLPPTWENEGIYLSNLALRRDAEKLLADNILPKLQEFARPEQWA